jgi:hypothetical protein
MQWIGMSEKQASQMSAHSMRVKAARDLLTFNIRLAHQIQTPTSLWEPKDVEIV